jgi:putative hemolysin
MARMHSKPTLLALLAAGAVLVACGSPEPPSAPQAPASQASPRATNQPDVAPAPSVTGPNDSQVCVAARAARAHGSGAAAALEKQCRAVGGVP